MKDRDIAYLNCGQTPATNPQQVAGQKMTIEAFRNFVKKQKRTDGYELACAITTNTFALNISGDAEMMLGFAILNSDDATSGVASTAMTFTVNNEIIVSKTNPNFFNYLFTDEEFYYFPRPLNGRDKINVTLESPSVENVSFVIYYI